MAAKRKRKRRRPIVEFGLGTKITPAIRRRLLRREVCSKWRDAARVGRTLGQVLRELDHQPGYHLLASALEWVGWNLKGYCPNAGLLRLLRRDCEPCWEQEMQLRAERRKARS